MRWLGVLLLVLLVRMRPPELDVATGDEVDVVDCVTTNDVPGMGADCPE
jgi:hypothetical protein